MNPLRKAETLQGIGGVFIGGLDGKSLLLGVFGLVELFLPFEDRAEMQPDFCDVGRIPVEFDGFLEVCLSFVVIPALEMDPAKRVHDGAAGGSNLGCPLGKLQCIIELDASLGETPSKVYAPRTAIQCQSA